jgi:hypothetical protein
MFMHPASDLPAQPVLVQFGSCLIATDRREFGRVPNVN